MMLLTILHPQESCVELKLHRRYQCQVLYLYAIRPLGAVCMLAGVIEGGTRRAMNLPGVTLKITAPGHGFSELSYKRSSL